MQFTHKCRACGLESNSTICRDACCQAVCNPIFNDSVDIEHNFSKLPILFVYAKEGTIKCLTHSEAADQQRELLADGWHHTATINAARWIEHLANRADEPSDILDGLQFGPSKESA